MGSSNRDYMQEYDPQSGASWGHDFPTVKWLLVVTVIVYVLQNLLVYDGGQGQQQQQHQPIPERISSGAQLVSMTEVRPVAMMQQMKASYIEDWFELDSYKVQHGQVWRLVTYFFCHTRFSPFSIIFNMLILYFFGARLERMYGSREILLFYFAAGIISGLVFTMLEFVTPLPSPLIGAGSSTMALMTLYATHFPREEILFCWIIPLEIWFCVSIYALVDLYWIIQAYSGQTSWAVLAYTSELWGIAFGYLYRRMDWHLQGLADYFDFRAIRRSFRRASMARKLRVVDMEPKSNLEEQVDAILAKIHEHGSESLTERERHILQQASERAKNRS